MRIAYFIGNRGEGRGGHFYDLSIISKHLSKKNFVKVFLFGKKPSPIINDLKNYGIEVENIFFNGINYLSVRNQIIKSIKKGHFDNLHCFDTETFFMVKGAFPISKRKILLSKCGGPNPPNNNYPKTDNLHVMSHENWNWFKDNNQYRAKLFMIPNRAEKIVSDDVEIKNIRKKFASKITFLRISRVTNHYKKSFEQIIQLANKLVSEGYNVQFVIIGVVQEKQLYLNLKSLVKNDSTVFITDNKHTIQASRLIDGFDFVIGTGRGIMEACSLGKVILTPITESQFPALIDDLNFTQLFNTNFSPRNYLPSFSEEDNLNKIIKALHDKNYVKRLETFSQKVFYKHFFIEDALEDYQKMNETLISNNSLHFWNLFRGLLATILAYKRIH